MAVQVLKVCHKCNHVGLVPVRSRICRQLPHGTLSRYCCGGRLSVVVGHRPQAEEYPPAPLTPQQKAARELSSVRKKIERRMASIDDNARQMQKLLKSLRQLQRSEERLLAKSQMTDEQVEAQRQAYRQRHDKRRERQGERSVALDRGAFERV